MNELVAQQMLTGTINIAVLLILMYLIRKRSGMNSGKVKAYMIVILLCVGMIVAEILTCVFDGLGAAFRVPNLIANALGFSLSPMIAFVLAIVFDDDLQHKVFFVSLPACINGVFSITSIWTGWIFRVSSDNRYSRGPLFFIYIIVYLTGLLLLACSNHKQSLRWHRTEHIFFNLLFLIIIAGTATQVFLPTLHSTWHCITITLVLYYLYQCELQFKYDIVTTLFNRNSFETDTESLVQVCRASIIMLDIDNFKCINDRFGHNVGDLALKNVATLIKSSFQEIGPCYRIGGDEFCVIAKTASSTEIYRCIRLFLSSLNDARKTDSMIPSVSYGCCYCDVMHPLKLTEAIECADRQMYDYKHNRKSGSEPLIKEETEQKQPVS